MKKFTLIIIAFIILLFLVNYFVGSPIVESNNHAQVFEDNWRTPDAGSEFTKIAQLLVKERISCGEIKIKKAIGSKTYYLCACKTLENEHWRTYQIWLASGDVLQVNDPNIKLPNY